MSISTSLKLIFLCLAGIGLLTPSTQAKSPTSENVQPVNAARYDNYRLYRIHLETADQVQIFADLEEVSDSVIFIGHALYAGQRLTILVAAHKVADVTELLERFSVEHRILVN